jgi:3-hydroxybutyryl-CoA dehydratase
MPPGAEHHRRGTDKGGIIESGEEPVEVLDRDQSAGDRLLTDPRLVGSVYARADGAAAPPYGAWFFCHHTLPVHPPEQAYIGQASALHRASTLHRVPRLTTMRGPPGETRHLATVYFRAAVAPIATLLDGAGGHVTSLASMSDSPVTVNVGRRCPKMPMPQASEDFKRRLHEAFDALAAGQTFTWRRTLTEGDVALFCAVTGDLNPYHLDDTFATESFFGRRIVPGLLTASMLTYIGGMLGFLATEMTFRYRAPVYVGDTVTCTVTFVEKDSAARCFTGEARSVNQHGEEVLTATFKGFPADVRLAR